MTETATLEECRAAFLAGDRARAKDLCETLLAAEPSCADAHNILSVIHKDRGEYEKARAQALEAIRCDGKNAKYYVNLGAIHMDLKQEDEAIAALRKAIAINSMLPQPYLNLGSIHQQRGNMEEAERAYLRAYDYSDHAPEYLAKLVGLYMEHGKEAHAEKLCRKAQQEKQSPQPLLLLAEAQKRQRQLAKAVATLEDAARAFPDASPVWHDLALLYMTVNALEKSEEAARKAVSLAPDSAENYNTLGGLLTLRGQLKEAVVAFDRAIALKPFYMEPYYNKADALFEENNSKAALAVLDGCYDREPRKDAWHMKRGRLLFNDKQLEEAAEQFNFAIAANPENVDAYAELGRTWIYMGETHKALISLQEGLKRDPDSVPCLVNSAMVHAEHARLVRAQQELERALAVDPENIDALCLKASFHITKGKYDAAEAIFDSILARQPRNARAISGKAVVYEKTRRFEEAKAQFEQVGPLALQNEIGLVTSYATVLQRLKETDKAIDVLKKRLEDTEHRLAPRQRQPLLFNLGNLYDKEGEYDKAWACYHEGNQLRKTAHTTVKDDKRLALFREVFTPEKTAKYPMAKNDSDLPVYIIGMPRSGTSLTEQILDSHSQVTGAGELDFVNKIAIRMSQMLDEEVRYPRIVEKLTPYHVQGFSDKLMEKMREFSPDAHHITDKMPHNFTMLGLIQLLVPRAKVIHLNRHPIDNCLSCYFQNFASGHEYSARLDHLAHHYVTYRKIMEHWRSVLSLPIFELYYESLVENPEPIVRQILGHIGLEFEPKCLEFHKSDRAIQTASYDQVRQPIYTKSAGRWKNYEKHIGPLIEGLESVL